MYKLTLRVLYLPLVLLLAACGQSGNGGAPTPATAPASTEIAQVSGGYQDLLALHEEFRAFVPPRVVDGVPDHTPAAMQAQHAALSGFMARLEAIDDSAWPIEQRVDYMIVLAEMRGVDFEHRVLAPWRRDPSYYSTVNLGFGPKLHGTISFPALPVEASEEREALAAKLRAIPGILAQARSNLTELKGDLAQLGLARKRIERNMYDRFATALAEHHPELVPAATEARAALEAFIAWLEVAGPEAPRHGGIGKDDYNWFLRYVLLYPYDWDQMLVLGEREYERAMAFLALEEHRNRATPLTEPAATAEEFERRRETADAQLLAFLRDEKVLTVPEYVVPERNIGPYILPGDRDPTSRGPFEAPIVRHFFRQTEDREPLPLRAHNVPGHLMDQRMAAREERPIRRGLLHFMGANRAEGWAYYLEWMIQQTGLLADKPGARTVNGVLQAKRAARIRPELMLQSNDWTFDEALVDLTTRTPRWMPLDDQIAIYDLEMYLRQPGLGVNYPIGRMQVEQILAERMRDLGDKFNLQQFHDEFVAAGMIPISLIRWQMTGRDDQIATMRRVD